MRKINTLLVANRGEIACRILRTAKAMGMATVAVYSEPDRGALHTLLADSAYCLGPAAAGLSYLNQQEILRVARLAGADAIHPGYGFLSENPEFAKSCDLAGVAFVGPPPEVITSMGIKSRARELMEQAGIPVIPGCRLEGLSSTQVQEQAKAIGFPLLVKADRGGGGKGIRLVNGSADLEEAIESARRESGAAFGDDSLLMEKQVVGARHIEVQIFRDSHGNTVHLFERDCSLQRRHQKILEEAPAPGLSERLRHRLHDAAVTAAETIGYLGAGTVEFLVSAEGDFYFLEINTRLQVEHPVTELVTGQDLVVWQLLVAGGERLPSSQQELACSGAAIEVRIYAENPARDFLPATGTISYLKEPTKNSEVRVDSGVRAGDVVTPYYDPILAKLIVRGADRQQAIARMQGSLADYHLAGVVTNIDFLQRLLVEEAFYEASHNIRWVDEHLAEMVAKEPEPMTALVLAALWRLLSTGQTKTGGGETHSPWNDPNGFRLNLPAKTTVELLTEGEVVAIAVFAEGEGYRVVVKELEMRVDTLDCQNNHISCRIDQQNQTATVVIAGERLTLFHRGRTIVYRLVDYLGLARKGDEAGNVLRAPIPGKVTKVHVAAGDEVRQGQPLLVLEAMKMEYVIRAPVDCKVGEIGCSEGGSVLENDRLVDFTPQRGSENEAA